MNGPSRGRRAAMTPSGIDTTIAAVSEIATSVRCSPSRRSSRPMNVSDATWTSIPNFSRQEIGRDAVFGHAIELGPGIHRGHLGRGDPSLQSRQGREGRGRSRLQVGAIEPDAFVRRERSRGHRGARGGCTAGSRRRSSRGRWPGSRRWPGRGRPGRGRDRGRRAGASRSGRGCPASRRPDP